MEYIVEDWLTEEVLKVFETEESRNQWIKENVTFFSDGGFLEDGRKVSIYEE